MHPPTMIIQPGSVMTVTADAFSSGSVTRLSDSAGSEPFAPVQVTVSSTLTVGPFSKTRRYAITSTSGGLTLAVAKSDLPGAAVADAAAATATAFPAGGVGAAAGGWDTAANRDLAIAAFTAALADIAEIRVKLNTLLARSRSAGNISA